jgi:hypothetical protein
MGWMDDDWWDIQWPGTVMAHNTFFPLKVFLFVVEPYLISMINLRAPYIMNIYLKTSLTMKHRKETL